jgi:hypothetical protein
MEQRTPKQTSTLIENCCRSILEKMNGDVDPSRHEKLRIECEKFDLNETFIKKLIFVNEERADKRKYVRKDIKPKKRKMFLN